MFRLLIPLIVMLLLVILMQSMSLRKKSERPIDVEPESAWRGRSKPDTASDDVIDVDPIVD